MSKHNKERKQKAGSQLTIPEDFTGYLSQLDQPDDAANPFEAMIDVLLGRSYVNFIQNTSKMKLTPYLEFQIEKPHFVKLQQCYKVF
jgi:hypothetical protein